MLVKIFKLGEEEEALARFPIGTHVLGRGPSLQCNDRRVSRNHATLKVSDDKVEITSTHINPCFLKMADSKTITALSEGTSTVLNDGDVFAFLPDSFWFKIKITQEDSQNPQIKEEETADKQGLKRPLNGSEEETDDKRRKVEDVKEEQNNSTKEEKQGTSTEQNNVKTENNGENNENNVDKSSSNEEVNNDNQDNKKNEQNQANDGAAEVPSTTAQVRSRRERCWYGAECYRKSAAHRQEFTHPGDSDFESDPDDNRPSCSFGAACYRKNKDHRRDYKHPPRGPPNKEQKKRTRKKVDRLNAGDYDDFADFTDSSEDPYEDDGDSDEYQEDSASEDSDYEDSQDVDEDSENVKRLVKEAKRFTKK